VTETVTMLSNPVPNWVSILNVVNVLLFLWFGFLILLASWKAFRWLLKWKP